MFLSNSPMSSLQFVSLSEQRSFHSSFKLRTVLRESRFLKIFFFLGGAGEWLYEDGQPGKPVSLVSEHSLWMIDCCWLENMKVLFMIIKVTFNPERMRVHFPVGFEESRNKIASFLYLP